MVTKVIGVVLHKQPYQELDEIITVFTPEFGKITFYALGIKKAISKNKYALQLFATSEFSLFMSKTNRMSKLKTGVLIKNRLALTKNYNDYLLAVLMLEILEQGWENAIHDFADKMFQLLIKTLDLFTFDSDNIWLVNFFYFWCLRLFGLHWKLKSCVRCSNFHQIRTISFAQEGFICAGCVTKNDFLFEINIVKTIYEWNNNQNYDYSKITTTFKTRNQAIIFLQMICDYYLNKVGIYSPSIYQLQKNSIYFHSKIV